MQKGKIIVTGGAGYIGSHTCIELLDAGYTPIIIDNFSNSEKFVIKNLEELTGRRLEVEEGDCNDYDFLKAAFKKHENIQGVIHFAAYKAVGESSQNPLKYYHNNLLSTVNLLRVMNELKINHLVFSSSCTVYGQPDVLPVTESSPIKQAESPYGNTKQVCESIIADYFKAQNWFKAVSLRYFNPIGAHPSSLIGELPIGTPNCLVPYITQSSAGILGPLTVNGNDYSTPDGTCIRDYIHVVDLAKAHVKALSYIASASSAIYDMFNIGTGNGNSVMEIITLFEKATNRKLQYKIGPRRAGDVEKIYADVSRSENILNWKAECSLEEALKDAWNWQERLISSKLVEIK